MAFWDNGQIKQYGIEELEIFEARSLTPSYLQEEGLSNEEKEKLKLAWQNTLPKLTKLQYLYISQEINQEYFEAICQIPNLKGLHVKTSIVNDFSPLKNLVKLEELNFLGTNEIKNLSGIEKLLKLRNCALVGFSGIEMISEFSNLTRLRNLHLSASSEASTLNITSLAPLGELEDLEQLSLAIKSNLDISPLLRLKKLQKLILPNTYHHKIIGKLPNLKILK